MKKSKLIILMAILIKAMEQVDSILVDMDTSRIKAWKSSMYTVFEDIQDVLNDEEE